MSAKVIEANSYIELSEKIENWISFNSSEIGNYDFIGMITLFKSIINNLQKYSIDHDFENLDDFFEKNEIMFLKKIIESHFDDAPAR